LLQYRTPGGIDAFLSSPKGQAMESDISRVVEVLESEREEEEEE